ncbi:MAG: replication initiation factor domain-containing protein [Pseudomonadota bacterium]
MSPQEHAQPWEHGERKDEHAAHTTAQQDPRLVTRGETHIEDARAIPALAHIDWFSLTVTCPFQENNLEWITPFVETLFGIARSEWRFAGYGWQGYRERVDLADCGLLAFGGERQRGTVHISLNAMGCFRVKDWCAVRVFGETYEARITRIDLAHDDFDGVTLNVERAMQWRREGGFDLNGRPANARYIDDFDSGDGKTLYIGKRQNGKLCRVYEKGRQLGGHLLPHWCRAEVELRNKGRVIPWDVLTKPGNYLAGAYPCFAYLSLEQCKLKTTQKQLEVSYAHMVHNIRNGSGRGLNVMLQMHQGDSGGVLLDVLREGKPKRLASIPTPNLKP